MVQGGNQPYKVDGIPLQSGDKFGFLEYVGDTGKIVNSNRVLLFFNTKNNAYEEHQQGHLLKKINRVGNGSGSFPRKKRSTSRDHVGVRQRRNKWAAKITVNHHEINIGSFDTERQASLAYQYCDRRLAEEESKTKIMSVINEARRRNHANVKSKSGEKGIFFVNQSGKWVFETYTRGKRKRHGSFSTLAEAIAFKHKYLGGN
ncbi:AP2/ERF family transcription factor [Lacticaseibacillus paracasei]|uniref:hypothetical protein n=1 Tax=Lacticaseibacillus paracasei TaxID=1597 RepID=UPI00058C3B06|nr:hypothetical protein [Lacticaseibacillus paracasei]ALX88134.1 hypothetical protein AWC33_02565 [Lacticaseibacillus paracasei]